MTEIDAQHHSAASLTCHAVEMAAEVGIDGLTVRGLARRAGVYPAAVTHHLGDLDNIRFLVADEVVAQIEIPPPVEPSDWRAWLTELALSGYEVIARYPGTYAHIARTGPTGPREIRIIDATMQVLVAAGLDHREAAMVYGSFIAHVGSGADLAALFVLHSEGRAARREVFNRTMADVAGLHPGLAMALPTFAVWDHDEAFRFGLELLLDAIGARVAATTPGGFVGT